MLFSSLLASLLVASSTLAAPWPANLKHATHRVRELASGVKVTAFQPKSTFEVFGQGIDHPLFKRDAPLTFQEAGVAFLESRLGGPGAFIFKSGFDGDVASHVFVSQAFNGIPVANAVANVAVNKQSRIVAFGSSFVKPSSVASSTPSISAEDAIAAAQSTLSATWNDFATAIEYFALDNGQVVLTHVVQVENEDHWFEAFVDAHTGTVVGVNDFVADVTYRVLPIVEQDPTEGFADLTDPFDPAASPDGWQTVPGTDASTNTSGNNAISFKTSQTTGLTVEDSTDDFGFTMDPTLQPADGANLDAARTNAFYIVNTVHDFTYRYGFTEAAFNFQQDNMGKGGAGNDRVTISVQDASGINNANFATPPDGQSGRMRMFLWNFTNPMRDGALENDVVSHENTHGVTNRMTGGGTGRCLQTTESGGLGEGWSDAMAEWTEHKSAEVVDFTLGSYVINSTAGIRTMPYSTNMQINNLTYADLQTRTEVHRIGEVWANMLHNVYASLVAVHGFNPNAKTEPDGTEGNVVWLHLFIDALPIQPCNPTFLDARLAWIQADQNRFNGANFCTLWTAFASRGLGVNAANHVNNFDVPANCTTS